MFVQSIENWLQSGIHSAPPLAGQKVGWFQSLNQLDEVIINGEKRHVPNGLKGFTQWANGMATDAKSKFLGFIKWDKIPAFLKTPAKLLTNVLKLPIMRLLPGALQYNLMFVLGTTAISAAYSLLKGNVGDAGKKVVGETAEAAGMTAFLVAIPKLLGKDLLGNFASKFGFFGMLAYPMIFGEPIKKLLGLAEKHPPQAQEQFDPAVLQQALMAQAQQAQGATAAYATPQAVLPQPQPVQAHYAYPAATQQYAAPPVANPWQTAQSSMQAAQSQFAAQQQAENFAKAQQIMASAASNGIQLIPPVA